MSEEVDVDDALEPLPAHAELEAALVADPDDEAAWMVLEDWILARGDDPRAEVVARERAAQPTGMAGRTVAMHMLGARAVRARLHQVKSRAGFVREAMFSVWSRDDEAALAAFAIAPGARLVTRFALHAETFAPVAAIAPLAPTLRSLTLTAHLQPLDLALLAPLARLAHLEAGNLSALTPEASVLARLAHVDLTFQHEIAMRDLAKTPLATAARVELRGPVLGDVGPPGALAAVMPAVRALAIRVYDIDRAAEAATRLVDSGILGQLERVAIETWADRAIVGPDVRARFRGGAFSHVVELVLPRALVTRERGAMQRGG